MSARIYKDDKPWCFLALLSRCVLSVMWIRLDICIPDVMFVESYST